MSRYHSTICSSFYPATYSSIYPAPCLSLYLSLHQSFVLVRSGGWNKEYDSHNSSILLLGFIHVGKQKNKDQHQADKIP
jgi:hypothetical protein